MAEKVVVYQKPTCTKCRQALARLRESGADFEAVDYFEEPLTARRLREILARLDVPLREAVRWDEPVAKTLKLKERDLSDDELIAAMAEHPELIQRPIVVSGDRAVLARPTEKLDAFLKSRR